MVLYAGPQNFNIFKFLANFILSINSGIGSLPVSPALPANIDIITFVFLFIDLRIFSVCFEV